EDMLDRRMSCLARRRGELAAVTAALQQGDDDTIEGVDALLATIEPIADCDDLEQLRSELAPPPADRRATVDELRDRLADLEVRRRTLPNLELEAAIAELLAEAEAVDYAPLVAEVLVMQSTVIEGIDGPNPALAIARRAMAVAAEAGHRRALVEATIMLAWIEGVGRANHELGLWLLDQAAAEAHALGDPVRPTLQIRSNRGAVLFSGSDFEAAMREFEAALAFAEARLGDDHIRVADLRFNIAAVHQQLDHFELAEQGFRRAVAHYTALMGADHPEVAQCHSNLAVTLMSRGKLDEAELHARRAIAIWTADGGHSHLPGAHGTLGDVALQRGDLPAALTSFERAHAMKSEIFGEANPTTLAALADLARTEHLLGRTAEGRARYLRGIELGVADDPEQPAVFELRFGLIELELGSGEFAAAQAQLDAVESRLDPDQPSWHLAVARLHRAVLEHGRGRDREARALLDQVDAMLTEEDEPQLRERAATLRSELDD
ncbi:MAG TPA: tetratricopeptide repeat protein, partial [Enhygromyxa sp.]|nr:tetratricopeptide repeat protein [Enhygromyxa sp.]